MTVPKYITEPEPGKKDSIRKWEYLLKHLEKGNSRPFINWFEHICGLCGEAGWSEETSAGFLRTGTACINCRFPGGNELYRCLKMCGITEKFSGILQDYKAAPNLCQVTAKDHKRMIRICNKMLKKIKSIKEMK